MSEERTLSKHLQGKYELVGVLPGEVEIPQVGKIDFRTATAAEADKFIEAGCPFIVKIEAAPKAADKK